MLDFFKSCAIIIYRYENEILSITYCSDILQFLSGCGAVGSLLGLEPRCRRFESCLLDWLILINYIN